MGDERGLGGLVSAPRYFEVFQFDKIGLHDASITKVAIAGGRQRVIEEPNKAHMDWHLTGCDLTAAGKRDQFYRMAIRFSCVEGYVPLDWTGDWIYKFDYVAEEEGQIKVTFNNSPRFEDHSFWCTCIEELEFELVDNVEEYERGR